MNGKPLLRMSGEVFAYKCSVCSIPHMDKSKADQCCKSSLCKCGPGTDFIYQGCESCSSDPFLMYITECEAHGHIYANSMLGAIKMPEGYALIKDTLTGHFYFVRDDGYETVIHWNKWAVRRWAIEDSKGRAPVRDPVF